MPFSAVTYRRDAGDEALNLSRTRIATTWILPATSIVYIDAAAQLR